MTHEELKKLDKEVAEKVMGWEWAVEECKAPCLNHGRCRKPDGAIILDFTPSTDIAAAFEIVQALAKEGKILNLVGPSSADADARWVAVFSGSSRRGAPSAPLAICFAALNTVGAK